MAIPGFKRRADNLLLEIARLIPDYTDRVSDTDLYSPRAQAVSYSKKELEIYNIVKLLDSLRYIKHSGSLTSLTPEGILAIEEMAATGSGHAQAFVAMSFSQDLKESWEEGFEPAIRGAGWRPIRIDNAEYAGGVVDQIMAEIRKSRFVVADWTQHRQGVYYEAGFATGLGLLVIPTCQKNDMKGTHFDTTHLNTLLWESPGELREKLERRIRAVIGTGPDVIE